ncbi:MAG: M24 family metallopeptidase [Actinomycetota bacterium]
MDHRLRRDALISAIEGQAVDAMLVTRLTNVRYLTGFTGSNAQAIVTPVLSLFFTDGRYTEQSRHEVSDLERVTYLDGFAEPLADACGRLGIRRLGFEAHDVTVSGLEKLREKVREKAPHAELVAVGEPVERLRWVKDAEEIALLNEAQSCTDMAFEDILERLAIGMTERQVALELEHALRRAGADGLSFESIVAFGEQSAEPHHQPTHRVLEEGDVIKMDFAGLYDGYHADMTRTIAFGSPPSELRKIHDVVRQAQQAAIDAVHAGVTGGQIDAVARGVIDDAGFGTFFTHGLGHGVGLEIHEGPSFRRGGDDVLPVGAVMTVEPGVYVSGLGGVRIEDMVEVGEDGCRVIGTSIRELIEL